MNKLIEEIVHSTSSYTLEVKNLIKKFGLKTAVNDASFSMKQGEIVGLLGPNGAGKDRGKMDEQRRKGRKK